MSDPKDNPPNDNYAANLKAELAKRDAELAEQKSYVQSLREEFSKVSTEDEIEDKARGAIKDMLPEAIMIFRSIMCTGDNEGTRASLAKFVIGTALDKNKIGDGKDDAVTTLLKKLATNDKDTDATTSPAPVERGKEDKG